MPATSIVNLVSINNNEITEHNRKISIIEQISASSVDLDAGITKKYIKKNKKSFTLNWSYLPNSSSYTVDQRMGRDGIKNLVKTSNYLTLDIKTDTFGTIATYSVYVTSYSESLIKRDISLGCSYYDVSLTLDEK